MKTITKAWIIVACLTLISWAGKPIIIVNKSNPVDEISVNELKKIYLGLQTKWSSGTKAYPADQSVDGGIGADFIKHTLEVAVDYYQGAWMEKMLSGAGTPPENFNSDQEVVDFVSSKPGAVGYVQVEPDLTKVKILKIK